ncbi:MAG: hypothetical protein EOO90_01625 [Pedobacter sp.]|nr:MAG: hypothetical protein EOO90_01625 [Pedobacter sp.]
MASKISLSHLKQNTTVYVNIKYGLIGVSVGAVMSLFVAVFSRGGIAWKDVFINISYSTIITLAISNLVARYQCKYSPGSLGFWRFILGYYACNLVGMVIGMEIANLLVSLSLDFQIEPFQLRYYRSTSVIVAIVGTLILFYYLQGVNAEALLRAKEVDLVKLNQSKTEAELQALQSKINPHFLYNALNSIVSLIHEDPDRAEEMTLKLSKLFRYSINHSQESFCSIREEIEILNTYLDIEKVRFGDRIRFTISVPDDLNTLQVPRFLLQPLVENSLKHGLKDVPENGEIEVVIRREGQRLVLSIHDNGVAFPDNLAAGYGIQSTFDKLQLLYKDDYEMQINNQPKKHIKISIPIAQ